MTDAKTLTKSCKNDIERRQHQQKNDIERNVRLHAFLSI